MMNTIPSDFWRADRERPVAHTVRDLKKLLDQLPETLPIQSYGGGVALIVYNITHDAHLSLEHGDEVTL